MTFAARLIAFEPAGDRLPATLLDSVSWDVSLPLNDVSALNLSYPDVVDAVGLADQPVEIAVEVSDGGDWVEPRNARFLSSEVQADLAAELDVPRYTFRGLGALLERPFVLRQSDNKSKPYTNDDEDPKRNFLSATAGQIITSVLQESRAKYPTMLQGIELGFTASKDSLGNNWDKLDSVAYSAGTDLLRVLEDMTARGICDWWMQGRTLMACNADKAAVHHSLRLNLLDVTESPLRATFENLASTVIVEGGQAKRWERPVSGASVPYGARVIRVANDSITTEGTALDLIARQALQATAPRREYTRTIALTGGLAPGISFECGDWIHAKLTDVWEEVRVHELGLSFSQDDAVISARVTLNDRFVDAAVRDAKRMQGITHGTTQNLGDGGIPSKSDKATPASPVGVAANSVGYWQDAVPLSSVDVSWQAVTADTNGLALNGVDYYEITCGGQTRRATATTVGFDELSPSRIYEVRVRAISSTGIRGKWSAVREVLTAYPLPQLDPPTVPSFRTEQGAFQAMWDGMLQGEGEPYKPPKHFSHVVIEVRREDALTWTRYSRDSGFVQTGLVAGTKYYARFIAVDVLDNESEPGPEGQVTVVSSYQVMQDQANQIATELATEKGRVTQALEDAFEAKGGVQGALGAVANLGETLTPQIEAAQSKADSTADDLAAEKVRVQAEFDQMIADHNAAFEGFDERMNAASDAIDEAFSKATTADGRYTVATANPTASDASGKPVGAVWEVRSAGVSLRRFVLTGASTWTQVKIGQDFIGENAIGRAQIADLAVGTAQIAAAAVTNAKIGNLAVTNGKIANATIETGKIKDLQVDKLTATGGAKFPVAVIDNLVGDNAFLTAIYANRVVVDPLSVVTPLTDGSDAQRAGWILGGAAVWPPSSTNGGRGARIPFSGAVSDLDSVLFQVVPGTKYLVEAVSARSSSTGVSTYAIQALFFDEAKTYTTFTNAKGYSSDVGSISGEFTVPADTYWVRLRFRGQNNGDGAGYWLFRSITCRAMTGAVLIEDGQVTAPKLAVTEEMKAKFAQIIDLEANTAAFNNAVIKQGFVESLVGNQAFLDSLYAQQIVVSPQNLVAFNPESGVVPYEGWYGTTVTARVDDGRGGFYTFGGGSGTDGTLKDCAHLTSQCKAGAVSGRIGCVAGDVFAVSAKLGIYGAAPAGAANRSARIKASFYDADNTYISAQYTPVLTGLGYSGTVTEAQVAAPAGARYMAIYLQSALWSAGSITMMDLRVAKATGAVLIENGAITTEKIFAGAVDADKIKAGALDAFQITSPLIQSVSTANRGIKWNGSTFVAYNNSGAEMIRLDGNTGLIKGVNIEGATITGGTLRTAASGQRVVIQNNVLWAYSSNDTMYARLGIGSLEFYYNTLRASIGYSGYLNFYHPDGVTKAMQVGGPLGEIHSYDSDGTERIQLARSTGLTLWSSGTTPVRTEVNKNGIKNYTADPGSQGGSDLGGLYLPNGITAYARLEGQSYFHVGSDLRVNGNLQANYPATTVSANAVAMGSTNSIMYRATSLRRAKADIQSVPNPVAESILDVPVRDWLDKGARAREAEARLVLADSESSDDARERAEMTLREGLRRIPGVIAEEVMGAGLVEFCTFDENGDLNGVMYDRLPLLLIPLVKDLRDRITDLERRLP